MNCVDAFEIAQREDMESFARFDLDAFRRVHHPEAISIFPSGRVARGVDAITAALAPHFAQRVATYTWRELHRFVDGCRSAFVLYETTYEIPSTGFRQRALTGVTYTHEGGRWLVVADQGSLLEANRPAAETGASDPNALDRGVSSGRTTPTTPLDHSTEVRHDRHLHL